ncbi:hypothetical protein CKO_01636 [Citrobacter koseri ATCC BAA-895]|uniref:Uncharacterized protein n=1 Tax=Citrobacter koseri (strain ATCC BAA-895 / CDC 4225-83 / SGSC4696) TaxID=290338 RepID=A8AH05_CITK8|nr:hypothetical protein CKO_01636 [Citrobacter koseri ATCC BAA-895]
MRADYSFRCRFVYFYIHYSVGVICLIWIAIYDSSGLFIKIPQNQFA